MQVLSGPWRALPRNATLGSGRRGYDAAT